MAKVEAMAGWREVWIREFVEEKPDANGRLWSVEARVDAPARTGEAFAWVVSTGPGKEERQRTAWGEAPTRERAMALALEEAERFGARPA